VHRIAVSTTTREARIVLEAAGIHDEGFTLPTADRMAFLARQRVGGMKAPIRVDFARAAVGGHEHHFAWIDFNIQREKHDHHGRHGGV
jgi:hypothetical protein